MARIMYSMCYVCESLLHHELRVGNHLTKHLRFESGTNTYISCEYMLRARLARVIDFASCYSTYALAICRHVSLVVMSARLPFALGFVQKNLIARAKEKEKEKEKKKRVNYAAAMGQSYWNSSSAVIGPSWLPAESRSAGPNYDSQGRSVP